MAALARRSKHLIQELSDISAVEICAVIAAALALRSYNLLRLPIYTDEATYLRWAAEIWEQRTRTALVMPITADGKPPLFMWLAGAAGLMLHDPLLAGRVVTVLAGTASAVGIYLAGCWLAGRRLGLLGALLYAAVPFSLFFDRMALVEGLLNMAGVWTFCASVLIATQVRSTRSAIFGGVLLGTALGVAIWTKTTGVFFLAFPLLSALLLSGLRPASLRGFAVGCAVFALFALLLALAPESLKLVEKAESFSISPRELLAMPVGLWQANGLAYLSWVQTYLPAPLWWLLPIAACWELFRRPRLALLLLGCWGAYTLPPMLSAVKQLYTTRYVVAGVFPMLVLIAALLVDLWLYLETRAAAWLQRVAKPQLGALLVGALLLLAAAAPSLQFDLRLLTAPESADLAATDRYHYITGWAAGYGFMDALQVVKQRAAEITSTGQPVIVLSSIPEGHPYDTLKLYMRGMPLVFNYVDMHLCRDAEGFLAAWRPHKVPLLVVGNEGRDDLDSFERAVPQAKRIGFFPKPTGRSSFRVYEVAVADLGP